jgi:hypothetical protein
MDSSGSCGSGFLPSVSVAKFSLVCGPIWASCLSRILISELRSHTQRGTCCT